MTTRDIAFWILRFVFVLALQVMVLKRMALGGEEFNFISLFLYPIFLLTLPRVIPMYLALLIGFFVGLSVDAFYNTNGLHASTSLGLMFFRNFILNRIEPPAGYPENAALTRANFGWVWFLIYIAIGLMLHLFWYFSLEGFSFVFIKQIMMRTLGSFVPSFLLILVYQILFNPKS